jgi:hypothetical protein
MKFSFELLSGYKQNSIRLLLNEFLMAFSYKKILLDFFLRPAYSFALTLYLVVHTQRFRRSGMSPSSTHAQARPICIKQKSTEIVSSEQAHGTPQGCRQHST